MKLTEAQMLALQGVAKGYITYTWRVYWHKATGARSDTMYRLVEKGLVVSPDEKKREPGKYELTALGRAALEELRKGKE